MSYHARLSGFGEYTGLGDTAKKDALSAAKCAAKGGHIIEGPPDKNGNATKICSLPGPGGGGGGSLIGDGDTLFGLPKVPVLVVGGLAAAAAIVRAVKKMKKS